MTVALATARDLPEMDQDDRPLAAALGRLGIGAQIVPWDDPVDWSRFSMVVVRSTWDYTAQRDRFLDWTQQVEAVTSLWNPAAVLAWNTHKGYLAELEAHGAPIVPTAWIERGSTVDLEELLRSRAWPRAVLKPAVGAGADGLLVVEPPLAAPAQQHLDALLRTGDVMVQPFLRTIERYGELSVVFLDGRYSHAVNKRPAAGDVRIQIEHGGIYERVDPEPEVVALVEWVLDTIGRELLYARADLIPDDDGSWLLGELEVTEPSLYLGWAPEAAETLADAIARRLT